MKHLLIVGITLSWLAVTQANAQVWPGKQWAVATPESQGLSTSSLDAAAEYAMKHGGGSGCVIRHGHLVKEWGSVTARADIKSATKGTMGATALGLAVDDGLVKLDDFALEHYPALGAEKRENAERGWLGQITVRQLATMTAGFDNGRPPLLAYRPGTSGIYSNDTANMLAELLTIRFHEDLSTLMKRRVLDPIGLSPDDWAWRENGYRAKTVNGLKSREFASGITITHRGLARIGYLYLREGNWNGRQTPLQGVHPDRDAADGLAEPVAVLRLLLGQQCQRLDPRYARRLLLGARLGRQLCVGLSQFGHRIREAGHRFDEIPTSRRRQLGRASRRSLPPRRTCCGGREGQ